MHVPRATAKVSQTVRGAAPPARCFVPSAAERAMSLAPVAAAPVPTWAPAAATSTASSVAREERDDATVAMGAVKHRVIRAAGAAPSYVIGVPGTVTCASIG